MLVYLSSCVVPIHHLVQVMHLSLFEGQVEGQGEWGQGAAAPTKLSGHADSSNQIQVPAHWNVSQRGHQWCMCLYVVVV